jgi:hypothetical protein
MFWVNVFEYSSCVQLHQCISIKNRNTTRNACAENQCRESLYAPHPTATHKNALTRPLKWSWFCQWPQTTVPHLLHFSFCPWLPMIALNVLFPHFAHFNSSPPPPDLPARALAPSSGSSSLVPIELTCSLLNWLTTLFFRDSGFPSGLNSPGVLASCWTIGANDVRTFQYMKLCSPCSQSGSSAWRGIGL